MALLVMKFGGTSVADLERIRNVAGHVKRETDAGNACAVVLDADALDADTMQAIARDMNLSETAFVRDSAVADFGAHYFTPT